MATVKETTLILDASIPALDPSTPTPDVDLAQGYGADVSIKFTVGGVGLTSACRVQVEVSSDQTNWFNLGGPFSSALDANTTTSYVRQVPAPEQFVRASTIGGDTDAVQVRIEVANLRSI